MHEINTMLLMFVLALSFALQLVFDLSKRARWLLGGAMIVAAASIYLWPIRVAMSDDVEFGLSIGGALLVVATALVTLIRGARPAR